MKFKNVSNEKLNVIGIGIVEAGQEVDAPKGFNNANFIPVKKETKKDTETETKKDNKVETKKL